MSRARSNDTVIPVDVGETTTGDGDWDSRQMMTMLTRCMQKLTTNTAVKVNLNLPKWTDEQDPEQFFTLFESVMDGRPRHTRGPVIQALEADPAGSSADGVDGDAYGREEEILQSEEKTAQEAGVELIREAKTVVGS